jgi:RNA polymerase sigma-70 factor (ECF subfamily)
MSSNLLDAQLIERYRAGETGVAEALVRAHQAEVFRLALSILDDAAEAEEAAQDALVAALNALDKYRGEAAFSTWLYRITVNECRGRLRKRRARERLTGVLQALWLVQREAEPHPEDSAARNERDAALWQAINALDEKHRLPLVLHYYHERPTAEIAQILALSEGTVHSRLHTARQRLRAHLRLKNHEP